MDDGEIRTFQNQLRALHRRQRREWQPERGMSRSSMRVLGAVARGDGSRSPGDLADELVMTSSNVASALRELALNGFVARDKDPQDSRRVRLRLTDVGAKVVEQRRSAHDTWFAEAVATELTAEEQRCLVVAGALMQRLADHGRRA